MNGDSNLVSPFPSSSAQLGVEIEEEPLPLKAKVGTFTHAGNVVDLCGVSANAGWAEKEGTKLPFGVTFLGGSGFDGRVLDIAAVVEGTVKGDES